MFVEVPRSCTTSVLRVMIMGHETDLGGTLCFHDLSRQKYVGKGVLFRLGVRAFSDFRHVMNSVLRASPAAMI